MEPFLPFERPIAGVEQSLRRLAWRMRQDAGGSDRGLPAQYRAEFARRERLRASVYGNLGAWERVQLARHPRRPHGLAAATALFGELEPIRGDRATGDDPAIVTGVGRWRGRPIVAIACERGADKVDGRRRNFGMPGPAGFRKAIRALALAEHHGMPAVSLVDTPGAWPGVDAERLGVAEAISRTMAQQARVRTPTLGIVLGEGGSGGALALAMGDRMLMMQNAYFSVISPEACASILWRDGAKTPIAAEALRLLPEDLLDLGIVDEVVAEPAGGAHRYPGEALCDLRAAVDRHLETLTETDAETLLRQRFDRYRGYASDLKTTEEATSHDVARTAP